MLKDVALALPFDTATPPIFNSSISIFKLSGNKAVLSYSAPTY